MWEKRPDKYGLQLLLPWFILTNELYNLFLSIGFERRCQNVMALLGFFRCHTVKWLAHVLRMSEFVTERCPHLQERIGESKLEDATSNRWISRFRAKVL